MKKLMVMILALSLFACGKKQETASAVVSEEEAIVESVISTIGGLSDDQNGSNYAFNKSFKNKYEMVLGLLFPSAVADGCSRAYFETCNAGVKQAQYASCSLGASGGTLQGQVQLSYSNASCLMSSVNDSVVRTYDLDLVGPRGGTVSVSSDSLPDYRNVVIGGGGQLTKTAGGWQIDLLGKHKILSYRARQLYSVSMRTLAPVQVTGTLARAGRTVSGGQLEVNHNLAGYTALFQANNLQWTGTCCHPVSGSLDVTFSGSRSGSATVTFKSCGLADFEKDGQTKEIAISYCE